MPELPEVETVRRQLGKEILGSEILQVVVRESRCFEGSQKIRGEVIEEISRVGKYLFVKFKSGRGLQIHLKMTGRLVTGDVSYETAKHTRVVMTFKDGRKIYYWDTRMFGYIKVVENIGKQEEGIRSKLGQEPWDVSETELWRKFQKTRRAIKEVILDQGVLAGVGNIYANDGLWLAGINPQRTANGLNLKEVAKLRESLCSVLERGLALGGASDNTYRDFYGGRGGYQNEFLTYGRTGEPCNKCGLALMRIVVGERGTWVCRECQV